MPMRGSLPLRNSYRNDFGRATNVGQIFMELIESRDFIVVIKFAAIGLLLSLCLITLFPALNEVMALFAQFP